MKEEICSFFPFIFQHFYLFDLTNRLELFKGLGYTKYKISQ